MVSNEINTEFLIIPRNAFSKLYQPKVVNFIKALHMTKYYTLTNIYYIIEKYPFFATCIKSLNLVDKIYQKIQSSQEYVYINIANIDCVKHTNEIINIMSEIFDNYEIYTKDIDNYKFNKLLKTFKIKNFNISEAFLSDLLDFYFGILSNCYIYTSENFIDLCRFKRYLTGYSNKCQNNLLYIHNNDIKIQTNCRQYPTNT